MQAVTKKLILLLVCCVGSLLCVKAQPSLRAVLDKSDILIGEQFKLKIVATLPRQDFFIRWIEIPDSLQHFEIVERSAIDSSFTRQKLTGLTQTITFTSFDSGKWVMPSFNASFSPSSGDSTVNLFTDSFSVAVGYLADSTQALRDIKAIREVTDEVPVWYWIAGAAGLLLLLLIVYRLYNYFKKRRKLLPSKNALSAYQNAIAELEKLKQSDLSSPAQVKQYHTRLPEILKQYLAAKQGSFYGSNTTSEMLILLNQKGINRDIVTKVAAALRCSDAVKFARYLPAVQESESCRLNVREAIDFAEQQSNNHKNESN